MKKVLITGASGFVGKYLIDSLSSKDVEIHGTSFHSKEKIVKTQMHQLDLNDEEMVLGLIASVKPDTIFHLAALTSPRDSFKNPKETFVNNVSTQINILESVRKQKLNCRIMIISSAEVYGKVDPSDLPIDEDTRFNPTNSYAVSKLAQDFLALQYFNSYDMDIVRLRPFNHTGPGQVPNFVIPTFAKKISEIEKGKLEKLTVGNLESRRDFTDVRDMVLAYILAAEKGKSGEVYNIGSGKSYRIGDILNMLLSKSSVKVEIREDPALMMPSDNPDLVCDYSKFHELTGWMPKIPIEKTISDILDYWRSIS